MRKVIHPFRFRHKAILLVSLFVSAAVFTAAAAIWHAGPLRAGPEPRLNPDIASNLGDREFKRSLQELAENAKELRAASERRTAEPSARRRKAVRIKPFVLRAAVNDGKLVFARTSRTITDTEVEDSLGALPVEVVVRDLASGNEQTVFRSRATTIGQVIARGGTAAFTLAKIGFSRRGISFDTSVAHVAPNAASAKVIASETFMLRTSGLTYCGRTSAAAAIDESGNLLLSGVDAKCQRSNELFADFRLISPSGADLPLSLPNVYRPSGSSLIVLSHGRLLSDDSSANATGLRDLVGGGFTPLVDAGVRSAALAADGTVAVVISSGPAYESGRRAKPSPFVVFPGGDPDRMVVASRSAGKIEHLKFCGDNLYAVKQLSSSTKERFESDLVEIDGMDIERGKFRVLAYDRNGALIKSLGDTPNMELAAVGCDTTALQLVAARGRSVTPLRYAP